MTDKKQILNGQIDNDEQKNGHFPIFLEIKNKKCLIIGSDENAAEKAALLLNFGAKVTVLAEKKAPCFDRLADNQNIEIKEKSFEAADLADCRLAIITDKNNPQAEQIVAESRRKGVLITVIDAFDKGDFIFPYLFQNGCITTAVSSGGHNPALAMSTKNMFEAYTPDYYRVLSDSISQYNEYIKHKVKDSQITKKIYNELFNIGKANKGIITEEHIQDLIKYYTK